MENLNLEDARLATWKQFVMMLKPWQEGDSPNNICNNQGLGFILFNIEWVQHMQKFEWAGLSMEFNLKTKLLQMHVFKKDVLF